MAHGGEQQWQGGGGCISNTGSIKDEVEAACPFLHFSAPPSSHKLATLPAMCFLVEWEGASSSFVAYLPLCMTPGTPCCHLVLMQARVNFFYAPSPAATLPSPSPIILPAGRLPLSLLYPFPLPCRSGLTFPVSCER